MKLFGYYIYFFSTFFFNGFGHIFVSFCPINMFLGLFERFFLGLHISNLNRLKPVYYERSFSGPLFSKIKDQDWKSGPVPVHLQSLELDL